MARRLPVAGKRAGLTAQQRRFIAEIGAGISATQAAIRAGYSARTAHNQGHRLMHTPRVAAAIAADRQARAEALELDARDYIRVLHGLCLWDPIDVLDERGNYRPLREWPQAARRALISSETLVKNARAGDGHTDEVLRLRFADRVKSVELMLRHLGELVERKESGRPGEFTALSDAQKLERLRAVVVSIEAKIAAGVTVPPV